MGKDTSGKEAHVINIASMIDALPVSAYQIYIVILCGFVVALDGFDTQAMAIAAPELAAIWGVPLANFGSVLSASLVGLMVGALLLGPMGDKLGRKNMMLLSFAAVGLFSLATAFSESLLELWIYRFLTGVGLGGTLPNALALTAEYVPSKHRTAFVTIMLCGFPAGAAIGGFISDHVIEVYSWKAIFWIGGALPIIVSGLLCFLLPESVYFLVRKKRDLSVISKILQRIAGAETLPEHKGFCIDTEGAVQEKVSIWALLKEGRLIGTLLIWSLFFLNLLILYFMLSWLPGLLSEFGLSRNAAFKIVGVFNMGGVIGGITLSFACDKWGVIPILKVVLSVAAIAMVVIAHFFTNPTILYISVFFAGAGILGAQFFLAVVAAIYYPTAIRSTGLGGALGVGRIGAIVAPLLGSLLINLGWSAQSIFMLLGAVALMCVWVLVYLQKRVEK
ncbi:MFS transporter [Kordiimonas pumila]|uniref:MFS transporter n=1 Tax=Kordiimonas pumila TaxID=2161677 RepID=A0ABV7D5W9_9PROT|nr:MFS transporter [Kordiimonas pumila]